MSRPHTWNSSSSTSTTAPAVYRAAVTPRDRRPLNTPAGPGVTRPAHWSGSPAPHPAAATAPAWMARPVGVGVARRPSVNDRTPAGRTGRGRRAGAAARHARTGGVAGAVIAAAAAGFVDVVPRRARSGCAAARSRGRPDRGRAGAGAAFPPVVRRCCPGCPAGRPVRGCCPDGPDPAAAPPRVAAGLGRPGRPARVVPDAGTADAGPPDEPDPDDPPADPRSWGGRRCRITVPAFPPLPARR